MKKVNIEAIIQNNEETIKNSFYGEMKKNTIKYIDNKTLTTIKLFEKKVILTRKNNEYSIKLIFKEKEETEGTFVLEEVNNKIQLKIYTETMNIEKNNLYVKYNLYDKKVKVGEYKYNIKIKEDI